DIARQHPAFLPNTYVYFVNSPKTSVWDFEGLFFTRYRQNVTVNGTDGGHLPRFRDYETGYVYYFDSTGKPMEIAVDKNDATRAAPTLPARFQSSIVLEQIAIPTNVIARGKAVVAIFVWRVSAIVEKDYTIFAHLVDANAKIVAQSDVVLASVGEPTSQWRPTRWYVTAIVLPMDANVQPGAYRLQIGLYDAATLERSRVVDANDQPIADHVVIAPFSIAP
ncbi:MAG: hypothetical protein L0Y55_09600, partial [Anaerolineales bacterium]|nr:hypothetical protein [Anaerolineales bacterium]